MPANSLQWVHALYDGFARGDLSTVLAVFHPQIVWMEAEHIRYADRNPYVGPQDVADGVLGRLASEWDEFKASVEQVVDGGECIVVLGRYTGVFKATGLPLDAQFAHLWTLREGRMMRFQEFTDTEQFNSVCAGFSVQL